MRFFPLLIFFLLVKVLSAGYLYAFALKKIEVYQSPEGSPIINVAFTHFPAQEILLALKRQRKEVLILYEFDILREGFFGSESLHKEVYYQKVGYFAEENLYYIEDNYGKIFFTKPEELLPKISHLPSYPLKNFIFKEETKKDTILLVTVTIKLFTHLDKNLRYTSRERKVLYKTSKKYVFQ